MRDVDARHAFFSNLDALPTRARAKVTLFGSRSACWPISGNFSARGAPRLWEFCNDFARVLRKICVTSARHSGFLACKKNYRLGEEMQPCSEVCAAHLSRLHANFVRAERRNSGKFAIFFRAISAQSVRDLNAGRARVLVSTH